MYPDCLQSTAALRGAYRGQKRAQGGQIRLQSAQGQQLCPVPGGLPCSTGSSHLAQLQGRSSQAHQLGGLQAACWVWPARQERLEPAAGDGWSCWLSYRGHLLLWLAMGSGYQQVCPVMSQGHRKGPASMSATAGWCRWTCLLSDNAQVTECTARAAKWITPALLTHCSHSGTQT